MRGKRSVTVKFCFNPFLFQWEQGSSWWWSYDSWIYNYLCNRCLSPLKLWVWIPLMARCMHPIKIIQLYVIMFVSNLWQVDGFSGFLHQQKNFPSRYTCILNIDGSGVKHHNPNGSGENWVILKFQNHLVV